VEGAARGDIPFLEEKHEARGVCGLGREQLTLMLITTDGKFAATAKGATGSATKARIFRRSKMQLYG
jgi:hypothetical protein